MVKHRPDQEAQYTEEEARRRVEATLRAAFDTPPKPQSEMKLGKRRAKRAGNLRTDRLKQNTDRE